MSDKQNKSFDTDEILNKAEDLTDNQVSYITHVRFRTSNNEVYLDLYRALPTHSETIPVPDAKLLHRIVMPLSLAKDLSRLMAQGVDTWEKRFGINLPISSGKEDSDESNN